MLTALVGGPFFFWLLLRTREAGRGLGDERASRAAGGERARRRQPRRAAGRRSCSRPAACPCRLRRAPRCSTTSTSPSARARSLAPGRPERRGQVDAARACSPATSRPTPARSTIDGAPVDVVEPDRARDAPRRCCSSRSRCRSRSPSRRSCAWAARRGPAPPPRTATTSVVAAAMAETDVAHLATRVFTLAVGRRAGARRAGARARAGRRACCCSTSRPRRSTSATRSTCSRIAGAAPTAATRSWSCMHDLDLAAAYADQIVVMLAAGRIRAHGRARRRAAPRRC